MRRTVIVASLVSILAMVGVGCASQSSAESGGESVAETKSAESGEAGKLDYPTSKRQEVVEKMHGREVADPYRWLEPNDDEAVREWMKQQNALTRNYLGDVPQRDALKKRYEELFYIESISAPTRRGGRMFYTRQHPDKEKDVYYWRPVDADASAEKVLLDPNQMGDGENISVGEVSPSWDGQKVAFTLKENNADEATLYVKDVESGERSDVDVIDGAKWADPSWTPDNSGFYYTHYPTDSSIPKAKRPGKADVRYHELGTEASEDEIVRGPTDDPRTVQGVELSRDGRWLVHYVWHGWDRSDVRYKDLEAENPEWKPLVTGNEFQYHVTVWKDDFYIKTDEGAPKFRVYKVSAENPKRDNWTEIVPEADGAVLKWIQIVGGKLVTTYLKDAHTRLEVHGLDGQLVRQVELPGVGSVYGMSGQPDHDEAYFTYQSFVAPKLIYKTSIEEGGTELWSKTELPVDTSKYAVEQKWYESKDGTKVSMFIVHKEGFEKDGSAPMLLYGYGGFNISLTPHFRESVIPWLEAGGAYAIPNLRGGGEYGEDWHEAGMLDEKQNTFDDFIAAAEYLVDEEYTSSDRLAIEGASNGGLLVSAVTTQRPELFGAVLCGVPLTDMLRYHEFGPAKIWMHEYGDPAKEAHFEFLYDYSPYHHVEEGTDYPAFMMLSSAKDDRVHPMHARKFTAALQWATGSGDPVLFRLEKKAGHGGADLIRSQVKESADKFAFLMNEFGVELPE